MMNFSLQIRRWAAILSLIFGLLYSIAQILGLLHVLHSPFDLVAMFIPSLLLAPAFVVVIISLHYSHSNESKILGLSASGFAVIYCVLASTVYFSQLASVIPLQMHNEAIDKGLLFQGKGIMVAVDCLAYGFMSLASLLMAFSFSEHKWLFLSFFSHGLLLPFIISAFFFPPLLILGALWMITFPWAMIEVIRFCKPHDEVKKKTARRKQPEKELI
jgi:hypothetical protein